MPNKQAEIVDEVPEGLLNEEEKEQAKGKTNEESEEIDEDEDEIEDEEEDENEDDDDNEDGDEGDDEEEHPLETLAYVLEELEKQEKRCSSRKITNLSFELANNVYPLMRSAFEIIGSYMQDMEEEADEMQEQQAAFLAAVDDTRNVAEKILEIFDDKNTEIDGKFENDVSMIADWAEKFLKQTEEIAQEDE